MIDRPAPASTTEIDLSVIVISHGHESLLGDCLSSLAPALAGIRAEVLMTDNLGGEPTFHVRGVPIDVRWHKNPQPTGFAANVNQAVARAAGKHVLLLNPDTLFRRGSLAAAIALLEQRGEYGILGFRLVFPDGRFQRNYRRWPTVPIALGRGLYIDKWPWKPRFYRDRVMDGLEFTSPTPVDWITGACLMFRRQDFMRAGGMDEKFHLYYEDVDLCYRFRRQGLLTVFYPLIEIVHSLQRSSATRPLGRTWRWHGQSMWHYFFKHRYVLRPEF